MRLPTQSTPVMRRKLLWLWPGASAIGVTPSRPKCITGLAVCKRGNNVLFTADETICAENTHANCTVAKNTAAGAMQAACFAQGGIVSHSGNPCHVGDNCRNAEDC